MKEQSEVVIFITADMEEEARQIAELLLQRKKAACVNIMPGLHSFFWWAGKIDSAEETLLIVKTKASLIKDVIRLVKEIHSYEVPEIIALPIVDGNPDYLNWINEVVSEEYDD